MLTSSVRGVAPSRLPSESNGRHYPQGDSGGQLKSSRLAEGTAEVTLTKAVLHFTGSGVTYIADANGDGMVDGHDFLELQRRGATAQRIAAWRDAFGTGVEGAALGVSEPAAFTLFAARAAAVGARRCRDATAKLQLAAKKSGVGPPDGRPRGRQR